MSDPDLFSFAFEPKSKANPKGVPKPKPKPSAPKYPDGPGFTNQTTSKAAAFAAIAGLNYQQNKIMEFLTERGAHGADYEELGTGCLLRLSSVCARVHELREKELVGIAERTRTTTLNREAQVYVLWEHRHQNTTENAK